MQSTRIRPNALVAPSPAPTKAAQRLAKTIAGGDLEKVQYRLPAVAHSYLRLLAVRSKVQLVIEQLLQRQAERPRKDVITMPRAAVLLELAGRMHVTGMIAEVEKEARPTTVMLPPERARQWRELAAAHRMSVGWLLARLLVAYGPDAVSR